MSPSTKPQKKHIVIIGAGPAGLSSALKLIEDPRFDITLIEASDRVGGMAKTIELWNQKVDLGPHRFFTHNSKVKEFWLECLRKDVVRVKRLTRILYKNKFYYYPLQLWDAFTKLGLRETILCGLSFLKSRIRPYPEEKDFASWVSNRFGQRLYKIFFKTYSEKLWGLPCQSLDSEFAKQRIQKLSLWEVIKNALFKKNHHKSLIDAFDYPRLGSGQVYELMMKKIQKLGGAVYLKSQVEKIFLQEGQVHSLSLKNGLIIDCDHIISTMPLHHLIQALPEVPAFVSESLLQLKFRHTLLVYLKLEGLESFPDQWLYIHDENLRSGRITNFRNWSPQLYAGESSTLISLEFWCSSGDPLWTASNEDIRRMAIADFKKIDVMNKAQVLDTYIHRIPNCYPIYTRDYRQQLKVVQDYLDTLKGLSVIGRAGSFKYNNQDHSILMGMLAAENLMKEKQHPLWEINNDENYQELKA